MVDKHEGLINNPFPTFVRIGGIEVDKCVRIGQPKNLHMKAEAFKLLMFSAQDERVAIECPDKRVGRYVKSNSVGVLSCCIPGLGRELGRR